MNAMEILDRLVDFPSVVGTTNNGIVSWIKDYAERYGAAVTVLPGPEGDRANLFAAIGPGDESGYILSGHMDVVPALEPNWTSDPFRLRADGGFLSGRGASDMKGFLAAAVAALPAIATMQLARPIHFALSYDEEAGCKGAPHLIRQAIVENAGERFDLNINHTPPRNIVDDDRERCFGVDCLEVLINPLLCGLVIV
jgi:acetylornithine deacetylase